MARDYARVKGAACDKHKVPKRKEHTASYLHVQETPNQYRPRKAYLFGESKQSFEDTSKGLKSAQI